MEAHPERVTEHIEPLSRSLRPVAVFLGLAVFLLESIVLGAAFAAVRPSRVTLYTGLILMMLGVSLVGGALLMEPSEFWLDPEVEFDGYQRYFVAGVSSLCLLVAAGLALFGG